MGGAGGTAGATGGTAGASGTAGATGGIAGASGTAGTGGTAGASGTAGTGGTENPAADTAFDAFNAMFYTVTDGKGFYLDDAGDTATDNWWGQAELIEMAIDAYDRNPKYATIMSELVYGFVDRWGTNWSGNEYNDDIAWMTIASVRAHLNTGNADFLNYARSNWDRMYARAWDTSFAGGGLWWRTDNNTKNACIQGPGAVGAYLLYKATGEIDYLNKAIAIYTWERNTLFEPGSGAIHDRIEVANGLRRGSLTYNQGTFIGIANYLYQETGNISYFNDAKAASDFLRNDLCNDDGLPRENQITGDFANFKAIGFRWLAKFVADNNLGGEYYPWLQSVANRAWANRRATDNISWNDWTRATPHRILEGTGSMATVQILQVVPPGGTSVARYNSTPQDGHSNIQAEACDEKRGAVIEDGAAGGEQLGGVINDTWARYENVDFGATAPATFHVHASVASGAGGTIEVHIDSRTGPLIGSCPVTSTGGWAAYSDFTTSLTPVTGAHDVYLVFKTGGGATHVANVDWFTVR